MIEQLSAKQLDLVKHVRASCLKRAEVALYESRCSLLVLQPCPHLSSNLFCLKVGLTTDCVDVGVCLRYLFAFRLLALEE